MAPPKRKGLSEKATVALREFEDGCVKFHDTFVSRVNERYDAYLGLLKVESDAAQWTSKLHPPLIRHIINTTIAGLLEERLSFQVKPAPRFYDPGELELVRQGAKAHERLHHAQLRKDRFDEKQRAFVLQNAIAGITVAKTYWRKDERKRKRLEVVDMGPELGLAEAHPVLHETETTEAIFDGPTTEVVNIHDFFWHEAAMELQRAPIVAHRIWQSFAELKRMECKVAGKHDPAECIGYHNVDELKEAQGSQDISPAYSDQFHGTKRSKDMIEVLEIWRLTKDGIRTVTIGNRDVELRGERDNPFWHDEYPFVTCSTEPDLFVIPGMSQVEKIMHLQSASWDVLNQTMDNVRLCNLAIMWFRSDVDDPDAFEFEPGARWLVEDPNQIGMWHPDPTPATLALPHLQMLKQDMQNLAGQQPFTSTSEARQQGANTATEAALVTSLAQLATKQMKIQLNYAYERIGQQRTQLNQQFIRRPVLSEQIGIDNEQEFQEISPFLLRGDYLFDISPMNESLMRQERRAEADAQMQIFLQTAPVLAAMGVLLNGKRFVELWLESRDVEDTEGFFTEKPQPGMQQGGATAGQPGQQPEAGGSPNGVTAPQSIDPAVSPSNQMSVSPERFMQRNLAMSGAGRNA